MSTSPSVRGCRDERHGLGGDRVDGWGGAVLPGGAQMGAAMSVRWCPKEGQRLFIGVYPTGLVYADRFREVDGDYVRLAYLNYRTLELEFDGPQGRALKFEGAEELRREIEADARSMQGRRGELFPTSAAGQSILLGGAVVRSTV